MQWVGSLLPVILLTGFQALGCYKPMNCCLQEILLLPFRGFLWSLFGRLADLYTALISISASGHAHRSMICLTTTCSIPTCKTTTRGRASNTPGKPSKAPKLSWAINATVGKRFTVRLSNRGVTTKGAPSSSKSLAMRIAGASRVSLVSALKAKS